MVERLTALLNDEAAALEVPAPPATAILRQGRRQRRRRRIAEGVAGIAAIGLVSAGVGTLVNGPDPSDAQQRFASASAAAAYGDYGAFSVGSTVHVGNHQVTFPEKIKAIYYTSAGVLVRTGDRAYTDEPGPSHYTLVRPDGSTKDIDLRMGDRVPGTDPGSPNVAYVEPSGATGDLSATETARVTRWDFVVASLETGDEVARTTVDGRFTWGGWEAPPVSMADTRMWALFDAGWMEYDWATGSTRTVPGTAGAGLRAAHGRYAEYPGWADKGTADWIVKDFVTGEVVAAIPLERTSFATFSPDGRYLRVIEDAVDDDSRPASKVVAVDTGNEVDLPDRATYGWTPDGHLLSVDAENDRLTVCDPATGDCDRIDLEVGSGKVRLGGLSYES